MQYNVTKIQKISNKLVLFWNGTDLIRPITVINQIDTRPGVVRLHTDTEIFEFSAYNITEITDGTTTRTYTALNLTSTDETAYKTRFQTIFQFLVTNILQGCCCDDSGNPTSGGLIQYFAANTTPDSGHFAYNLSGSGKLIVNLISGYNQDFADLLHHYSPGSKVWFFSAEDQSVYSCFQITNYALSGSNATWDATLLDGSASFTTSASFYVLFDDAGSGGGGSQSFQQTLDVDSAVDKNNLVDGGLSFEFYWALFNKYGIQAITNFFLETPKVYASTAVNGYPLTLQNLVDGDADFNPLDTVGIKNGAVTYEKIQNVNKDSVLGRDGTSGVVMELTCTQAGRDLIAALTAAAQRSALGIRDVTTMSGGNVGGTIAAGVTSFLAPTVDAAPGGTEANRASVISFAGNAEQFYYSSLTAQPASGSFVLTLRKATGMGAFSSTAVTITIAAGSAAGIFSDTVNTAPYSAGDRASIQITNNATGASHTIGTWMLQISQTY